MLMMGSASAPQDGPASTAHSVSHTNTHTHFALLTSSHFKRLHTAVNESGQVPQKSGCHRGVNKTDTWTSLSLSADMKQLSVCVCVFNRHLI